MLKETGYLRFGGSILAEQNNFAGLGAIGGSTKGVCFATLEEGVLAHLEHLYAYCSKRALPAGVAF